MATLLAVDDQPEILDTLRRVLSHSHEVLRASSGKEALQIFEASLPDCVLLDIDMPGMDGIEVLRRLTKLDPNVPVIMLTGALDVKAAVSSFKEGAYDYLTKPPDFEELNQTIDRAIEKTALLSEVRRLRGELSRVYGIENIIGKHPRMLSIFETVSQVASRRASVLIMGDSGTGKELIARAIHQRGIGPDQPFVAVNCAAIPDGLVEAELFGHERGAFTDAKAARAGYFERSQGGTIFLDEVSELSLPNQAKLLRVLQEREVVRVGGTTTIPLNVRVIAATNRKLDEMVEEGSFRQDLYYRVNIIPIELPSLQERRSDIPLLVGHFIARIAQFEQEAPKGVSPEAMRKLMAYAWPGNVRELENMIERLMALTPGDLIDVANLPQSLSGTEPEDTGMYEAVISGELSLTAAVDSFEDRVIRSALSRCDDNKSAAASMIGITRRMLRYKLGRGDKAEDADVASDNAS
jgi:DNA-binding NtrC family response regulator